MSAPALSSPAAGRGASPLSAAALPGDYPALLKPRVMSLVVFTGLTGLLCARTPMNPVLAGAAVLAIAVGAGASGALNMAFDGDIDALMRRTRGRPVAAGRVRPGDAAAFGGLLGVFAVMVMGLAVNLLAAALLLFTILFYAVVYTVWLKRSTPQNIVIGGAAGALPPVIGWAAASGATPLNAWLLFALIFLWTPPHFWALALNSGGDYEKAGVPMMPVVRGARATRLQILLYSIALWPTAAAPLFTGLGGLVYGLVAVFGGGLFVVLAVRVFLSGAGDAPAPGPDGLYTVKPGAKAARDLFAFSILYLFALFAALLIEHIPRTFS